MNVGNILAMTQKELRSYFGSPIAYVVTAAFLVVAGYMFAASVTLSRQATLAGMFAPLAIVLLIIVPTLTMRLLAEESRTGTIELLLTSPVRDVEVVLGKYFGAFVFFLVMLALTAYYPILLFIYGEPDVGPMLSGYLGLLLLGGYFLSIGLFASSLTQNQIVAAVLAFALLLVLWLLGIVPQIAPGWLSDAVGYLGIVEHYGDFSRGIIDTRHVVYFLSVIVAALFLTVRSLESRRWR